MSISARAAPPKNVPGTLNIHKTLIKPYENEGYCARSALENDSRSPQKLETLIKPYDNGGFCARIAPQKLAPLAQRAGNPYETL